MDPLALPGWYSLPSCAPSSYMDRMGRQAAGWPAVVLRLRFNGVYLPHRLLTKRPRVAGKVLSIDRHGAPAHSDLIDEEGCELLHTLCEARVLKRRDDGSMLIGGEEWDEGYFQRWPQTWLCSESIEALESALLHMQDWLHRQYEAARNPHRVRD